MTSEEKDILEDFPIFRDNKTVYLDSAATSQKPVQVLEAVNRYYSTANANPLRGLYKLSLAATDAYESARKKVADFINAEDSSQIIFTRNASESLNLVAYSYGMNFLHEGDEIIITIMEHHSNMLPWQQVAQKTGAHLIYLYCTEDGTLLPEQLEAELEKHPQTKIVAVTQVSNVFGCENNIKEMASLTHRAGAVFVCDGAQSVPHIKVDVQDLDVDFLAFSGHKMLAPMGIGALYGKARLLEKMPPFMFGGEMIEYVTTEGATYAEVPHKFEAGTVNAGGAVGLGAAVDYYNSIGFDNIIRREDSLTELAMERIEKIPHVNIIGSREAKKHHGIITFTIDGVHPHDIAAILDADDICIRAGHHCAQPLMKYLKVMATARASIAFYNTEEDIVRFTESVSNVRRKMGYGE